MFVFGTGALQQAAEGGGVGDDGCKQYSTSPFFLLRSKGRTGGERKNIKEYEYVWECKKYVGIIKNYLH